MAWRIVLDSMVWAQAARVTTQGRQGPAAEILGLALSQQFVLVASSHIRAEVIGVLAEEPYFRRKLAPGFDPETWGDEVLAACADLVEVTGPPVLHQHAKDDPILWLAAAGGASHLVTWEERLLDLKHYRFTQVVTPPAFLRAWRNPAAHEPLAEWKVLRGGPASAASRSRQSRSSSTSTSDRRRSQAPARLAGSRPTLTMTAGISSLAAKAASSVTSSPTNRTSSAPARPTRRRSAVPLSPASTGTRFTTFLPRITAAPGRSPAASPIRARAPRGSRLRR